MNQMSDDDPVQMRLYSILNRLIEEGTKARVYFQIWDQLNLDQTREGRSVVSHPEFGAYFYASKVGAYSMFMLALSKLFDRDSRSAGFSGLINALNEAGHGDLAGRLHAALEPMLGVVAKLMTIRNKSLIHNSANTHRDDVYEQAEVLADELRLLVETVCECIESAAKYFHIQNLGLMTNQVNKALSKLIATLS